MKAPFDLNPQQNWDVTKDDLVQSVLAVECRGTLNSYFENKPIPEMPLEPGQSFSAPQDEPEKINSTENARFLVVASTRFVNNQFLSMFRGKLRFFSKM